MGQRLELHTLLKSLLQEDAAYVYYQPPANILMQFPCIVYSRDAVKTTYADNKLHSRKKRYQVTVIDSDPDSEIPDKVAALPMSSFQRFFVTDQLNHDIFNIYF